MSILGRKLKITLNVAALTLGVAATVAYAVLPATDVPPQTVPHGTLAGKTPLDVFSVDAFTRAINQAHGSNGVLQHGLFAPSASTGWHTHPGPNIVFVAKGSFKVTDEHCNVTEYGPGQGFATGLNIHKADAGPDGADYYSVYFLPADADVLRTTTSAPICAN